MKNNMLVMLAAVNTLVMSILLLASSFVIHKQNQNQKTIDSTSIKEIDISEDDAKLYDSLIIYKTKINELNRKLKQK
jgi:hypothetical protein